MHNPYNFRPPIIWQLYSPLGGEKNRSPGPLEPKTFGRGRPILLSAWFVKNNKNWIIWNIGGCFGALISDSSLSTSLYFKCYGSTRCNNINNCWNPATSSSISCGGITYNGGFTYYLDDYGCAVMKITKKINFILFQISKQ